MEPTRGASRFVRGRARGGGAYRPYFYFRRNGQTIRGGKSNETTAGFRGRRRGGHFANVARVDVNNSGILPPVAENSFLRATHFAAPDEAFQSVHSIAVEPISECPGWRLYFKKENYDASSELAKRIKVIEKHYITTPSNYDLLQIQAKGFFRLDAQEILKDEELKKNWPNLIDDMRNKPIRSLSIFGIAMYSVISVVALDALISLQPCSRNAYVPRLLHLKKIYARPYGFANRSSLAEITNEQIDKLVSVRGCIAAASGTEVAASWICFRCSRCNQQQSLKQTGNYISRPYTCKRSECHAKKGFVELRTSPYTRLRPLQTIRIVEQTLEDIEFEQRQKLNIELQHDLVESFVPGQDIIITGVLKMRSLAENEKKPWESRYGSSPGSSHKLGEIYLKAVSILDATNIPFYFSERDMNAISAITEEPDTFKLLVHSIAPEVCGHEIVKAGILLSLFGGAGTQVHDESEINILLVGDPGAGKSHILQMCSKVSEKGIFLNGKKGTSTTNVNTIVQGRTQTSLNFGAFIVSLQGHTAFDDIDRIASQQDLLLQIMQSQGVTLPFPGVFITHSMQSSVIASANSSRGHYNNSKLLSENIRVSPALISQFHLIFVLSDKPNKDLDMTFTEHIQKLHAGKKKSTTIASHYVIKPRSNNSFSVNSVSGDDEMENDDNYNLRERLKLSVLEEANIDLLPPILIKKYIAFARQKLKPLLNATAVEAIKKFYMEIRKEKTEEKSSDSYSSQLMGLIRLSQARARLDFSAEVTKAHVRDVLCIVRHCIDDMQIGDYIDFDRSGTKTSMGVGIKKFLKILQLRSNALSRRTFELDELKEMAQHVGISSDILNIIDAVNLQGFIIKKGSNIYEVTDL